jgi:hypothetical protein
VPILPVSLCVTWVWVGGGGAAGTVGRGWYYRTITARYDYAACYSHLSRV